MDNTFGRFTVMNTKQSEPCAPQVRRIPARVPARVSSMASLRFAARTMVESGVAAVLVESPIGPVGLVTAYDLVEAIAAGADPDVLWAGEISRPASKVVSSRQNPVKLGEDMVAERLEMVAVMDEGIPVGVVSALDVLRAVLRRVQGTHDCEL